MKPTFIILLTCSLLLTARLRAQVECVPLYLNEYAATGNIEPQAIKTLTNGNSIVAGRGSQNATPAYDGMVMQINPTGTILWSYLLGGTGDDIFNGVLPLTDGSFILYGNTQSFGHPEGKGWLVHISNTGALIWSRQLGSSLPGAERLKDLKQFTDGDIIGTLNENDSSGTSNPVVFKMETNGTLKWTRAFDNGGEESFTSIASQGSIIYASGYVTVGSTKRAVISELNSVDGSVIASRMLSKKDNHFNEEIVGLEVSGNSISYGISSTQQLSPLTYFSGIIFIREDLSHNTLFNVWADNDGDYSLLTPGRTPDNGFLLLRSKTSANSAPSITKISPTGLNAWGNLLSRGNYNQTNPAFDIPADGGAITAGYFTNFSSGGVNRMQIMRMNAAGETGGCGFNNIGIFTDTTSYRQQAFNWVSANASNFTLNEITTPASTLNPITYTPLCNSSFCTDKTPLPPGCNKTYRIEYEGLDRSLFRDVAATSDGQKIAVGDAGLDGMAVKFDVNGDVLWSKNFQEFFHQLEFIRILRMPDDNFIIFANNDITVNHGASTQLTMIKIDGDGNILWTKDITRSYYSFRLEFQDVAPTPDNGFVTMINDGYGSGGTLSYVIRYDQNANIIWKKELVHPIAVPVYRSITCSDNAVLLAYDNYDYINYHSFGVDKMDLSNGNLLWSFPFSLDPSNIEKVNRIFSINDTAYVFVNNVSPVGPFGSTQNTILAKLDKNGKLVQSLALQSGDIAPLAAPYYYHVDVSPPTVTLTPDRDFVMCNKVNEGAGYQLNVSRFNKDGNPLWSRNFTGMTAHKPYNIHPQGTGFLIVGEVELPHPGNTGFRRSFSLKIDSSGRVLDNATGDCAQEDRPFTVSPASIDLGFLMEKNSIDLTGDEHSSSPIITTSLSFDAVPFCQLKGNCAVVSLRKKGIGCALTDTLVYYLQDPGACDASATWQYDSLFFKRISVNGDSIQLLPLKGGISGVTATIEGSCFLKVQKMDISILQTAGGVHLGNDTIICDGQGLRLHAGAGYASYRWNDNSTDSILDMPGPGKYFVTVRDYCGSSGSDTIVVSAINDFFHVTGDTIKCNNDPVTLQASAGYTNYQWSPGNNINATGSTAVVNPSLPILYFVTAEKNPGCPVKDSIRVNVLISPTITLPPDTSICNGDSILLQTTPLLFNHYSWNTADSTTRITVKKAGNYIVSAQYLNGCYSKDTFRLISLYSNPIIELDKNPVLCTGQERTLSATGNYSNWLWSDGSRNSSIVVNKTGQYWVSVLANNGCNGSDTTTITTIASPPTHFLPADTTICQYGTLSLVPVQTFKQYQWNDFSSASSLTITKPGSYWLQVTDKNNCTGKDTINIVQVECMEGLYVPTAFTPNRDGRNDVFKPLLFGNISAMEFSVYDRWGNKVFQTNTPGQSWNGLINGIAAPSAVYVWYCKYTLTGQPSKNSKGTVTLIR